MAGDGTPNKTVLTPTKPHLLTVPLPVRLWRPITFKLPQGENLLLKVVQTDRDRDRETERGEKRERIDK